ILSLWANGTSIDVPGPPILTFDEMIAWPPPTASRIGWPRRGGIIAAPCSISPATPTIAAFPYATAGRESKLARSSMTRGPSSAASANSGDRSSTNRSANGLSTTATATARVMGWLISRPASAKIVSLVKLSLRKFIAVLRCYEARTSYSRSDEGWHQLFRRDGRETTVGQSRQDPAPPAGMVCRGAAVDGGWTQYEGDRYLRCPLAHRHRQEERHHDGRLRHSRRAQRGPGAGRGDLPGLYQTLPADQS